MAKPWWCFQWTSKYLEVWKCWINIFYLAGTMVSNLIDLEQREFVFCACLFPLPPGQNVYPWGAAWKSPAWDAASVYRKRERRYTTEWHLKLCSEVTAVHLPWPKACHKDEPDTEEECGLWTGGQLIFSSLNLDSLSRKWKEVKPSSFYSLFKYYNSNHGISCSSHFERWIVLEIWADLEEPIGGFK